MRANLADHLGALLAEIGRHHGAILVPGGDGQPWQEVWVPEVDPDPGSGRRQAARAWAETSGELVSMPPEGEWSWLGEGWLAIFGPPLEAAQLDDLARRARRLSVALHPSSHAPRCAWHSDLSDFNRIAASLTSTLSLDDILSSTIEGVRQILDVEAGALLLVDGEGGDLVYRHWWRADGGRAFEVRPRGAAGLVIECLHRQRPVWSAQGAGDASYVAEADGVPGIEVRSLLCAPLLGKDGPLGAIQVVNKTGAPFGLRDLQLLCSLGACVSSAILNARLIHQLTLASADLEASRWEVLRSRSTLQALFDGITAPIYIVDRSYTLLAVNQACSLRRGSSPPELLGRLCHQALYRRDEPCPGCRTGETLYGGACTQRVDRRWGAEGDPEEWDVSTYPILDERSQPVQAVVLEQDVTEKRRLQASLAQSEKLAAVGQLAAGVAHEINNPLAAILANAQLLERELPDDPDWHESLDLISQAGQRAMRVVRNLLDFSRQDAYEMTPTDVNESLESAADLVQPQLANDSVRLQLDLAPDLPPVLGSRDHLQSIWLNLLLNARDAVAPRGGGICVLTRRMTEAVQVVIADEGEGIPPERINRIFDPFYTTKAPGRGTGLGLSACHRIVKQHSGTIRVDSEPGRGTQFTVTLPVHLPV